MLPALIKALHSADSPDAIRLRDRLDEGDDETEVSGDRLVQGQDLEAVVLEIDLAAIYLLIPIEDLLRKVFSALEQGGGGLEDG